MDVSFAPEVRKNPEIGAIRVSRELEVQQETLLHWLETKIANPFKAEERYTHVFSRIVELEAETAARSQDFLPPSLPLEGWPDGIILGTTCSDSAFRE